MSDANAFIVAALAHPYVVKILTELGYGEAFTGSGEVAMATADKARLALLAITSAGALNDPKMAALYAEMIGTMNASPQGNVPQVGAVAGPQGAGGNPGATGGVNPQDPTGNGGGNIGPGNAPMPGEAGFAA